MVLTIVRVLIVLVFLCARTAQADADTTTIGVTLNGTTGAHIEPQQTETIPFLPLPMFELEHVHKQLHIRLEAMPPIGPVPLAQNANFFGDDQNPRVSYLNGELSLYTPNQRYAFGIGETVINQRTLYPPSPFVQSSRVVGMRWILHGVLYDKGNQRVEASLAVNPGLQGLQQTTGTPALFAPRAERGSLVDTSLHWTIDERSFLLVYGVRYLNYTAAYSGDNSLADRNHLFMPFVGIDWPLRHAHAPPSAQSLHQAGSRGVVARSQTTFSTTLLGTNGSRSSSEAYSATLLPFSLVPMFALTQTFEGFQLTGEAILPNAGTNPYAAPMQVWSYLDLTGLGQLGHSAFALGLGDTIVNLRPATVSEFETQHTRAEGLHLEERTVLWRGARSTAALEFRLTPYVHVFNDLTVTPPAQPSRSFVTIDHGVRVEAWIHRVAWLGKFGLDYGLRYVNQTTNYGAFDAGDPLSGLYLTRSSSLMPYVGIKAAM
ncbi:MAG TPA: hypothetical protein VMB20_13140 [Candidatus Acidoferrum sp.]|nr:hypothetical protein [Candidatus Acidoferrum sp.]